MNPTAVTQSCVEKLHARTREARVSSDRLFEIVRPEALYDRPIPERHRIIFYVGHLEAFDWNLLSAPLGLTSFDPILDKLFAFGIDPTDGGLPNDQPKDWPSLEQVREYNTRLREALDGALLAITRTDPKLACIKGGRLLDIATEHRLMHAETLAYMLHQLPLERKLRQATLPAPAAPTPSGPQSRVSRTVEIPAGTATLGKTHDDGMFGWDNEYEAFSVQVPAFTIDANNVTNQDYLRFMSAGGYRNHSLWSDAGWESIRAQGREHPVFWVRQGDTGRDAEKVSWLYRGMFEEIPLPLDWPVYVSHDEATAYARWKGAELPSEAEWHRAAFATRDGSEHASPYPWGAKPPGPEHGNFDFARWEPVPVGSFPAGSSPSGVADLVGNGWEWTRTPFASFPGFKADPFYPGYSANFFDEKHFVMKGGSPRTAARMLRRSFRNWFQPHYPYVYSTFRCVQR